MMCRTPPAEQGSSEMTTTPPPSTIAAGSSTTAATSPSVSPRRRPVDEAVVSPMTNDDEEAFLSETRSSDSSSSTEESPGDGPTNEYVLNIAFLSFLGFTTLQLFFAILARSQAMMADCAAMYVDVVTYLFNFMAERLKHRHANNANKNKNNEKPMSPRDVRLYRLYLELIPPLISVTTLVAVTILTLRTSFTTLLQPAAPATSTQQQQQQQQPNVGLMLLFSALNLLLDVLNVTCFARVDQAVGLPGQHGTNQHYHHHDSCEFYDNNHSSLVVATEQTPLLRSSPENCSCEQTNDGNNDNDGNDNANNDATNDNEQDSLLTGTSKSMNLNMCSAWTHVCADTMRSVAVLVAAGFSSVFPNLLSAADADSWGAIVVSVIILVSLVPLIQQLYLTACKIQQILKGAGQQSDEQRQQRRGDLVVLQVTV